jgi:hypothetical protein
VLALILYVSLSLPYSREEESYVYVYRVAWRKRSWRRNMSLLDISETIIEAVVRGRAWGVGVALKSGLVRPSLGRRGATACHYYAGCLLLPRAVVPAACVFPLWCARIDLNCGGRDIQFIYLRVA